MKKNTGPRTAPPPAVPKPARQVWRGIKLCPRIMRKKTDYRRKGRRVERIPKDA